MTINWSGKRRWIALILLIAGILVMLFAPPVIPVIQLPGERYPAGWDIFGLPITNTLVSSVIVWILLILLAWYVSRVRPRGGNEVPHGGFYNLFEMLFEGLYNFVKGIAGERYIRYIFSFFMTIFLYVLLSNWQSITPGVDSIGFLHERVLVNEETGEEEFESGYDVYPIVGSIYGLNGRCAWVSPAQAAALTAEQQAARAANDCLSGTGQPLAEGEEVVAAGEEAAAEQPEAAEAAAEGEAVVEGEAMEAAEAEAVEVGDPAVPWQIVPFVRPASTDLNMTLALALIAVVMVQVLGFRALGPSYLTKFFNFKTLFTSPLGGIDVAVGLLELIGEFARILSFGFRLLGNLFAGSVLLFVMSFLITFLPWPFFILEFFVGVIQALVFALLTAIFMNLATASHGHDEGHGDEAHAGAEAH